MKKINTQHLHITLVEFSIVLLLWLITFLSPLILNNDPSADTSQLLIKSWYHISTFFILFLINHLIIVPEFLFKRRRVIFVLLSIALVSIFSVWEIHRQEKRFKEYAKSFAVLKFEKLVFDTKYQTYFNRKIIAITDGTSSATISVTTPAKGKLTIGSAETHPLYANKSTSIFRLEPSPLVLENQVSKYMKNSGLSSPILGKPILPFSSMDPIKPISFFSIMIMFIVYLLGTGIRVIFHWIKLDKESVAKENQSIKNELNFLKNQINPHFFMNTLNNIHSLIDIDPEKSQVAIVEFSKLMRYMLYDSEGEKTDLESEIKFLENYISLMKLRFTDAVSIDVIAPSDIPHIEIPPLLFTSLVENSFKHGISYQKKSFVRVEFIIEDTWIKFTCINSNFAKEATKQSGIGVENTKKRLDLIYNDRYELEIESNDEIYKIMMRIPYDKMHSN